MSVSGLSMTQSVADKANSTNTLTQAQIDAIAAANKKNGTDKDTTASSALSGNFDTFIKLLTTQLQNQDPTAPTDTSQFTQQLVMYSQVEQQIGSNKKLDSILTALTQGSSGSYVDYIGKTVAVTSDKLLLSNSSAALSYTIPDEAAAVKINILDANKNVVATLNGDPKIGDHNAIWDGKKADGSVMADGTYTFQVVATKADGTALTGVSQYAVAKVTAVKSTSSGAQLELNGSMKVDPLSVVAIGG